MAADQGERHGEKGHVITLTPAYGRTATYIIPTCSCGWSSHPEAYRTATQARKRGGEHVVLSGSIGKDVEGRAATSADEPHDDAGRPK